MTNWLAEMSQRPPTDEENLQSALDALPEEELHRLALDTGVSEPTQNFDQMEERFHQADQMGREMAHTHGDALEKQSWAFFAPLVASAGRMLAGQGVKQLAGTVAKDVVKNVAVEKGTAALSKAMTPAQKVAPEMAQAAPVAAQGFKYASAVLRRDLLTGILKEAGFGADLIGKGISMASKDPRKALALAGGVAGAAHGFLKDPGIDPRTGQPRSRLANAGKEGLLAGGAGWVAGGNKSIQGGVQSAAGHAQKSLAEGALGDVLGAEGKSQALAAFHGHPTPTATATGQAASSVELGGKMQQDMAKVDAQERAARNAGVGGGGVAGGQAVPSGAVAQGSIDTSSGKAKTVVEKLPAAPTAQQRIADPNPSPAAAQAAAAQAPAPAQAPRMSTPPTNPHRGPMVDAQGAEEAAARAAQQAPAPAMMSNGQGWAPPPTVQQRINNPAPSPAAAQAAQEQNFSSAMPGGAGGPSPAAHGWSLPDQQSTDLAKRNAMVADLAAKRQASGLPNQQTFMDPFSRENLGQGTVKMAMARLGLKVKKANRQSLSYDPATKSFTRTHLTASPDQGIGAIPAGKTEAVPSTAGRSTAPPAIPPMHPAAGGISRAPEMGAAPPSRPPPIPPAAPAAKPLTAMPPRPAMRPPAMPPMHPRAALGGLARAAV